MELEIKVISISKDDLVNIIVGFNSYSNYWCSLLDWDQEEYYSCKKKLEDENNDTEIVCYEDILAQMLLDGYELKITDDKDIVHILTKEKIINGLNISFERKNIGLNNEDWDVVDYDIIIQNSIYGEIVYG